MAIQIPSIDDRTYEQLVDLLRRQIAPGPWTDHNASDPGMMLVEELCWLGEMALYRMNQVPESHEAKFLNFLIDPPEPVTVNITFTVTFLAATSLTIDAGTLLATDYMLLNAGDVTGHRFVFETVRTLKLDKPTVPATTLTTLPVPDSNGAIDRITVLEIEAFEVGDTIRIRDVTDPLSETATVLQVLPPDRRLQLTAPLNNAHPVGSIVTVAKQKARGTVKARAILQVVNEPLGVSDGSPHQRFELRPPRQLLGITDPEAPTPVLTDFIHPEAGYEPNPQVSVAGTAWTPVPSLLTERSRVALGPATHYMVSAHDPIIRFGGGVFGAIPPSGAAIECTRYRVLDGPTDGPEPPPGRTALKVKQNELKHALNFAPLATDVLVTWTNSDAEGGNNFFPRAHRFDYGLRRFRAPFRLVTEHDFERAVMEDFNKFQHFSDSTPQIARASVVFDRKPPLSDNVPAPSHVTYMLLRGAPFFDEDKFRDEAVPFATKAGMVAVPAGLWGRIQSFLDRRRLITTRLNQQDAELVPFTATAAVSVAADRNVIDMEAVLRTRIYDFLSLLTGDFDAKGWKLGRNVYRSQLFRWVEEIVGVDHVDSLTLSPADAQGNVVIGPHQLPMLEKLTLTVNRV